MPFYTVTSVTLSRLNSINANDVTAYLGDILGIFLEYIWDILGIFWGYFWQCPKVSDFFQRMSSRSQYPIRKPQSCKICPFSLVQKLKKM